MSRSILSPPLNQTLILNSSRALGEGNPLPLFPDRDHLSLSGKGIDPPRESKMPDDQFFETLGDFYRDCLMLSNPSGGLEKFPNKSLESSGQNPNNISERKEQER